MKWLGFLPLVCFELCLVPVDVRAENIRLSGVVLNPNVFYVTGTEYNDDLKTERTSYYLDLQAGYIFHESIYFGIKYLSHSVSQRSFVTDETTVHSGIGPSIGYYFPRLSIVFSYLLNPERLNKSGGIQKTYYGGSSYTIDIGYRLQYGFFGVGPQISYVFMDYKSVKDVSGSSTLTSKFSDTYILPYVGLWFFF